MNSSDEVRAVVIDGLLFERRHDGSLEPLKGQTDWARIDAMTDEELTLAAESDPDARPMTDEEWAKSFKSKIKKLNIDNFNKKPNY